jgi:hypothetical protein
MRTHVYLESMAPDGTPGAVKEIQVSDEAPQYLEPLAANDDLGKLRANVHEARAKLQHAKARGKGVAEAQKAFETAKSALDKLHYDQKQERQRQRTGGDHPFAPQSEDTRMFMEPVSYADNDYDGNDTTGRTFDDESDHELEAKILAAVTAIETAQSNGASWAEILKLEQSLKVLRDQLPNSSAPPKDTTAPPRREHIERPAPPQGRAGQAGWNTFLAALDVRLRTQRRKGLQATHSTDVCCTGKYLCSTCRAKAAVV